MYLSWATDQQKMYEMEEGVANTLGELVHYYKWSLVVQTKAQNQDDNIQFKTRE